jgi:cytidylate kinase
MPVITVVSGNFCRKDAISKRIIDKTGYQLITDDMVAEKAHELSGLSEKSIQRAFTSKTSLFNNFTHEKERAVAWLKLAMSSFIEKDKLLIDGVAGLLIPKSITHVLRVLLIAEMTYRMDQGTKVNKLSDKDVHGAVKIHDENASAFVNTLFRTNDPWADSLYDIVIPVDKMDDDQIIALVDIGASKTNVNTTSCT